MKSFERRQVLDPSVNQSIVSMEQTKKRRSMTPGQRREEKRQKARNRLFVDLPPDIEARIGALAAAHGVTISGLVVLAIVRFLRDVGNGLDLTPYKQPTKSPRFDWRIVIPENDDNP